MVKERLLSFGKYAENAAPDVLVTLIQNFVERIYITDENDELFFLFSLVKSVPIEQILDDFCVFAPKLSFLEKPKNLFYIFIKESQLSGS